MNIISLFKNRFPRRHYGQCQRCSRTDYLPWATEHGVRFCGHCSEKDALEYARLAGWTPPQRGSRVEVVVVPDDQFAEIIPVLEENAKLKKLLSDIAYVAEFGHPAVDRKDDALALEWIKRAASMVPSPLGGKP